VGERVVLAEHALAPVSALRVGHWLSREQTGLGRQLPNLNALLSIHYHRTRAPTNLLFYCLALYFGEFSGASTTFLMNIAVGLDWVGSLNTAVVLQPGLPFLAILLGDSALAPLFQPNDHGGQPLDQH
jgi:hypothetical protein